MGPIQTEVCAEDLPVIVEIPLEQLILIEVEKRRTGASQVGDEIDAMLFFIANARVQCGKKEDARCRKPG